VRIVGGEFRGLPIAALPGNATRPTADRVRESLFDILGNIAPLQGARVADIFAGTGALGLEAASRGAGFVLFIENDFRACEIIKANIARLGIEARTETRRGDATRPGRHSGARPFDLVFADPPYGRGLGGKAAQALAAQGWLAPGACFVLEEDAAARIEPPPGFLTRGERRYGRTRLYFWQFRPSEMTNR
jgi:16S rRNA (guanine966-N2)-methyltransferase